MIKCQLFNRNWSNYIKNWRFWSSFTILIVYFHQIQQNFDKMELFWYKIKIGSQIWVRIRIEIFVTIDRTGKFGSIKLIKSQFEYDVDRLLAWPWLDRISLHFCWEKRRFISWPNQWTKITIGLKLRMKVFLSMTFVQFKI